MIPIGDSSTNQGQCFALCPFCILQPFKSKAFGVFGCKKGRPPACPCLAERKGFEPSMQLPTYKLSRLAPSTTRTPLYFGLQKWNIFWNYQNVLGNHFPTNRGFKNSFKNFGSDLLTEQIHQFGYCRFSGNIFS